MKLSEKMPLVLSSVPQLTTVEKNLKWFGWTCTTMAMTAQGFLGLMLMDFYLFKSLPFYLRFPLDIAFFIAAEESKRRIVINHSQQSFIDLAKVKWKPSTWTLKSVLWQLLFNIPLTIGGVYAFTGITGMSLDGESGGASLLRNYGYSTFDAAADVLDNRWFQIPFMLAAVFVNSRFFPEMNRLAWSNIKNGVINPFESFQHRAARESIINSIETGRIDLKKAYEKNQKNTKELLEKANFFTQEMKTLMERPYHIKTSHFTYFVPIIHTPRIQPRKDFSRFMLGLTGFIGTIIGIIGFSNFYGLCGTPILTKMIHIFTPFNPSNALFLSTLFSLLGYGSMISTSAALIPLLVYEIPRFRLWAGDHAHIKVSSTIGLWINAFIAIAICVLGSTPNMYQAARLQQQAPWLVIFAGIASFSIEFLSARQMCKPIKKGLSPLGESIEKADNQLIAVENNADMITRYKSAYVSCDDRYYPWIQGLFNTTKHFCPCKGGENRTSLLPQ